MEYYEIRQFTHRYSTFAGTFLPVVFLAGFWCSRYSLSRAFTLTLFCLFFVLCVYQFCRQILAVTLRDAETISRMMIDVVDGQDCQTREVYKEGTLGILYTNFYKMVGILRESQMKTKEEKEFLQKTISDISHQLKTPLASLQVFVELLCDDKVTEPAKQKQILSESQNQLSRMEWMVLSMLKLARIEAGVILFDQKMYSGPAIAEQAAESVRYLTDVRSQTIRILRTDADSSCQAEDILCADADSNNQDDPLLLCCDREWLTEALINLLKNASDYSPEHTQITITFEDNRLYSRICVKDQGMGIPEDALPHIFDRFYRRDNSANPNSVGIGLSLTKSIVEGMGGRITVRSKAGKGACFILTFMK